MITRKQRREQWFEIGAEALKRITRGRLKDLYLCPLCYEPIGKNKLSRRKPLEIRQPLLTFEDVPPKSSGLRGTPMVLTCKDCNDWAGHQLDAHLARRTNLIKFAQGTLEKQRRVKVDVDGFTAGVLLRKEGTTNVLDLHRDRNDPVALSRFEDTFREVLRQGSKFQIAFIEDSHDSRRAEISLLRAAYLVAFAAFGYRYIMGQSLDPVRKQIRNPDTRTISTFSISVSGNRDLDFKRLAIVHGPEWSPSILVQFGNRGYILPLYGDATGFYDQLDRGLKKTPEFTLNGNRVSWPTGPKFALDTEDQLGEVLKKGKRG